MQSGVLLLAALAGAAFGTGAYAVLRRKHRIAIAGHQNIVIVGSSSGVGRAIALQYARRGASLCLIARRNQEQIKQECLEQGARDCCAFTADASKAEDIVGLHSKLRDEAQWAQVDTLIIW